jgi:pimeloyl-ACP methyl ester carboxylesterase
VVLVSPFDSLVAVGKSHMPWLPIGLLLRHRFDSLAHAPSIKAPALVITGGADTLIAPAHSERLASAWGGPVERLQLEHAGHNDIGIDPRYAQAITAFLDRRL